MKRLFAHKILLPGGWADDVRLQFGNGRVQHIETGARASDDEVFDFVIPGISNSHSHAFQRALAGRTEERSPAGHDNFWTWRERMYELAAAVDADRLAAIAQQAFVEMVSSGYTSVAEFHYLHRDSGTAMFDALVAAASGSGIRLAYMPVLYERAGFDDPEPQGAQRIFAQGLDAYLEHRAAAANKASSTVTVGAGVHSIRAASAESLRAVADVASSDGCPMHLHIAEQQREVDQSLDVHGRRPVRWLLENFGVGRSWCLVHATHMDPDEIDELAGSGAVVSLCPSTEANLGDGLFPLAQFLGRGGRIAIGSDSHVSINPFEELRWLEYGQRLAAQARNIAAVDDSHVGHELFGRVIDGGAQACGRAAGGIVEGAPADLVCLYGDDPMLLGHDDESRLDALVFSGYRLPIERVMVNGDWCVVDGKHVNAADTRDAFAAAIASIRGSQ